ncbi:DNA-processing protein DprA [Mangrovihabitans endophyticus]|uniref:DNA protecting protein DprA n=1 Tax=Mangrovihabitans endophyticus TaxID=1751298 RepID=A0A8J3C570_9ACTN|nr:DNA-processing protein DprA [Mangrovihabitans endophyticus]GGL20250.1 DNA protecting protein DprA [Mangrovihabitans endophyticus]
MNNTEKDSAERDADRVARVALSWLAEPGNPALWSLVQADGAPAALQRLLAGDVDGVRLSAKVRAQMGGFDPQRLAETALIRADRIDVRLVVPGDPEWPDRLDDLAALRSNTPGRSHQDVRPPLCLWVRGQQPLNAALHRAVAVVGAQAASGYGVHVTTDIAYGLAQHDWTIVSGGAFGVDAAAHRAALAAAGRTVAVLACGLDRPHPAGNSMLFDRITETGLLVSAWPPGFEPAHQRFPARDRMIAAATVGTVLTEAASRSAAVRTARWALALHRAAMAVPGPTTSPTSVGCHDLLRTYPQAVLVTGFPDVLETIARTTEPAHRGTEPPGNHQEPS